MAARKQPPKVAADKAAADAKAITFKFQRIHRDIFAGSHQINVFQDARPVRKVGNNAA